MLRQQRKIQTAKKSGEPLPLSTYKKLCPLRILHILYATCRLFNEVKSMETLEVMETINYTEILTQINENIITNNNNLEKILNLLDGYKIAMFLLVFSMAIIVAYSMFKE